jgi:hypothetical protein
MGFWHNLKLRFQPPRINDPDFGQLTYMYVSNHPERSYWEGEWPFPGLGHKVAIALTGSEEGPDPRYREFYLNLPGRLNRIIGLARPRLAEVFEQRLKLSLPEDIFSVVKLSSFDVEDPAATPLKWNVGLETTGDIWLGILIPFIDEVAQKATVDT